MTSEDDTVLEAERYLGFEKAMKDNNLEIDKSLVKNAGTTYDYGYEKMKEILDEGNVPEAVFVTGDEAAIGALNAI